LSISDEGDPGKDAKSSAAAGDSWNAARSGGSSGWGNYGSRCGDSSESGRDHSRHVLARLVACGRAVETRGTDGRRIFESKRQYSSFGIRGRPVQDRDSMSTECEFNRFHLAGGAGRRRAASASFVLGEGGQGGGRIIYFEF